MPEWDPEVQVDAERAHALIAAQFPELAAASVCEVAAGWDNVVHRVDERWAFRFPQRAMPVDPMRRADMGFRIPHARRRLDEVIGAGLWEPTDAVEELLKSATGLPTPSRTLVSHGDLHMRHVLVDEDGHCAGIIDRSDVSTGDPSATSRLRMARSPGQHAKHSWVPTVRSTGSLSCGLA